MRAPFVNLGTAPPSNHYLSRSQLQSPESWYPLRTLVCERCWLVQTEDFASTSDLFSAEYAYFSGYSSTWVKHCETYVDSMIKRLDLDEKSHVVEIASNDGTLLEFFARKGIANTGIEPTRSTAAVAKGKGLSVVEMFFTARLGLELHESGRSADLVVANNVLAHVPDINDFVAGVAAVLKPEGVATFEFPHLLRLVSECQFDTVYHEHFSYLSLLATLPIFERHGLVAFEVQELSTHGGSLRVFFQHASNGSRVADSSVRLMFEKEIEAGMATAQYYSGFQQRAETAKNEFLRFLLSVTQEGASVVGYGAAAKGNTLLNFAGIRGDLLRCVVDRNPAKQNRYLPGSRIPIFAEHVIKDMKPDYVVILPWNLSVEITSQLQYIREWGAKFVTAIPSLRVH